MNLHLVTCAFGMKGANRENVFIFAASAARHLPEARITIFAHDTDLRGIPGNVRIIPVEPDHGHPILTRWKVYREHLPALPADDVLLLIDSRDVVFNADPWPAIRERFLPDRPMFFSEHQTTGGHPWCTGQAKIIERFSSGVHALDVPEVNGGAICGSQAILCGLVRDLAWGVGLLAKCKISDQPIINRWARENPHVLMEDPRLYCHGELVKQGRWKAGDPRTSAIYHQFDRVPEHRAEYAKTYEAAISGKATTADGRKRERKIEMRTDIQAVASHYKEDLEKLRAWLPTDIPLLIYAKGPDEVPGAIRLPNVGYEAHTYFHHFATQYDNLPAVTVCLQANPFDHFKKDADRIRDQINAIDPNNFSFAPLAPIGFGAVQGRDGSPHHPQIAPDIEDVWRRVMGYPPPDRWFCWYAAQFAVHRDLVTRRPREWWARAAEIVQNKHQACVAERMWGSIFA